MTFSAAAQQQPAAQQPAASATPQQAAAPQQPDFSKVEITTTKVAGNIYMLSGRGGNIGVDTGDDGVFLIDDEFEPLVPKINAAVHAISPAPVRFVLNTHYHYDHTDANATIAPGATIIAHDNVRARLQNGTKAFGREFPPAPKAGLPVLTYDDQMTLHLNGEDVRIIHYPNAHTDGDSIVWFPKSNVLHMGDEFFNGGYPVLDVENGGTIRGLTAAIDKTLAMVPDDVKIIPGHGPLGDKASLRAFNDMLKATSDAVAKEIKAGKTAAQLKDENVLAPWNDQWDKKFVSASRYIDELYADFSAKK